MKENKKSEEDATINELILAFMKKMKSDQNLIDEKFSYNPNNGKNCYLIRNKKIDKNEKFKLYLIKSKPNSLIPEKAFGNCYVINFTCPSNVISDTIYDSLCNLHLKYFNSYSILLCFFSWFELHNGHIYLLHLLHI